MEYNKDKREIVSNKNLNELDKFVLKFINILKKHVDYVIISGYVSIILGRSRATEDVDVFIKKISKTQFNELYSDMKENGFWCINAESVDDIFDYLLSGLAVRFALEGKGVPNFEVKFPKDKLDDEAFEDFIKVILPEGELKISSLERHIAFKRYYLSSDKDMEDALHVEELFKDKINYDKINKLKLLIKNRKNGNRK